MDLNKYQNMVVEKNIYPMKGSNLYFPICYIAKESGKLCEFLCLLFINNGEISDKDEVGIKIHIQNLFDGILLLCYELRINFENEFINE